MMKVGKKGKPVLAHKQHTPVISVCMLRKKRKKLKKKRNCHIQSSTEKKNKLYGYKNVSNHHQFET